MENDYRNCPVCAGMMHAFRKVYISPDWIIQYHICQNCELIHSYDHSFFGSVLYSEKYFNDVDIGWQQRCKEIFVFIDRHFQKKKPLRILDIGSGTNYIVYLLLQAGYDAYGVDSHSEPLYAQDRFFDNFSALPYNSYDVIVLLEVLEHLIKPLKELEGFMQYLGNDGKFLFSTVIYKKRNIGSMDWYINPKSGHVTIWSMKAMYQIFSKFRFKNAKIYRSGNLQIWDRAPGSIVNNWSIQSAISPIRSVFGRIRYQFIETFHDLL